MANQNRMKPLNARLSRAGFSARFLRERVLPKAWSDEMAADDARYQRLLEFLSRHLAIEIGSLKDASSPVIFDNSRTRFFKGPDITEEAGAGLHLAEGVVRVALSGMSQSSTTSVPSALTLRRRILDAGQPWVGFRNLLAFCWNSGIPVIHVQNLPPNARRLRGVAVQTEGQSAIVLCQQFRPPARQLIPLAHELGHLSGQHMDFIGFMASTEQEVRFNDRTEGEAHRYATELLTGGEPIPPNYHHYRHPQSLVDAIYEQSHRKKIDPGYLIVKRAGDTGDWREASAALNIVEGENSASDLIAAEVRRRIDASLIPSASRSFFTNITGVPLLPQSRVSGVSQPRIEARVRVQQPVLETSIYPESLLQKYNALVRQGYLDELSPEQTRELASVREEIQEISRNDKQAQAGIQMVEDVNVSLDALEERIEARIAQREAEQRREAERTT